MFKSFLLFSNFNLSKLGGFFVLHFIQMHVVLGCLCGVAGKSLINCEQMINIDDSVNIYIFMYNLNKIYTRDVSHILHFCDRLAKIEVVETRYKETIIMDFYSVHNILLA